MDSIQSCSVFTNQGYLSRPSGKNSDGINKLILPKIMCATCFDAHQTPLRCRSDKGCITTYCGQCYLKNINSNQKKCIGHGCQKVFSGKASNDLELITHKETIRDISQLPLVCHKGCDQEVLLGNYDEHIRISHDNAQQNLNEENKELVKTHHTVIEAARQGLLQQAPSTSRGIRNEGKSPQAFQLNHQTMTRILEALTVDEKFNLILMLNPCNEEHLKREFLLNNNELGRCVFELMAKAKYSVQSLQELLKSIAQENERYFKSYETFCQHFSSPPYMHTPICLADKGNRECRVAIVQLSHQCEKDDLMALCARFKISKGLASKIAAEKGFVGIVERILFTNLDFSLNNLLSIMNDCPGQFNALKDILNKEISIAKPEIPPKLKQLCDRDTEMFNQSIPVTLQLTLHRELYPNEVMLIASFLIPEYGTKENIGTNFLELYNILEQRGGRLKELVTVLIDIGRHDLLPRLEEKL